MNDNLVLLRSRLSRLDGFIDGAREGMNINDSKLVPKEVVVATMEKMETLLNDAFLLLDKELEDRIPTPEEPDVK